MILGNIILNIRFDFGVSRVNNIKKICVFGDSISKGVTIDTISRHYTMSKNSFVNLLSDCEPWLNVKNYSMFGCTISKGLSLISRHMKDVDSSDAILLEYGGNDSDFDWAAVASAPDKKHLPKTPLDDFAESYRTIIEHLRGQGKKIIMLNLPPIDEKKYFTWLGDGLNRENIIKWLGGDIHYIYEFHDGYNAKVCEISSEYGIPLIDIRSEFLRQGDYSNLLCFDGIHPNEKGHALIAQTILDYIPSLYYCLTLEDAAV
jgi:acyl-CoA thioesterase-1